MNELIKDFILILAIFCLVYVAFYLAQRHDTIEQKLSRYDCDLVHFEARIPDEIIMACRNQKLNIINKQKD